MSNPVWSFSTAIKLDKCFYFHYYLLKSYNNRFQIDGWVIVSFCAACSRALKAMVMCWVCTSLYLCRYKRHNQGFHLSRSNHYLNMQSTSSLSNLLRTFRNILFWSASFFGNYPQLLASSFSSTILVSCNGLLVQ